MRSRRSVHRRRRRRHGRLNGLGSRRRRGRWSRPRKYFRQRRWRGARGQRTSLEISGNGNTQDRKPYGPSSSGAGIGATECGPSRATDSAVGAERLPRSAKTWARSRRRAPDADSILEMVVSGPHCSTPARQSCQSPRQWQSDGGHLNGGGSRGARRARSGSHARTPIGHGTLILARQACGTSAMQGR
jgi:hypothetical protein